MADNIFEGHYSLPCGDRKVKVVRKRKYFFMHIFYFNFFDTKTECCEDQMTAINVEISIYPKITVEA